MNNDRASSFLCSFQTFQTFMSLYCAHALPATRNICPVVCSPTSQFVLQHCTWGTFADWGMGHHPSCSNC